MPVFVGLGQDYEIKNFALTTSDTTVTFTRPTKSIVFRVAGGDAQLRRNTADVPYFPIFEDEVFSTDIKYPYKTDTTTLGFFRMSAGTGTLYIMAIY